MQIDYVYNKNSLTREEGRSANFLDYSLHLKNSGVNCLLYTDTNTDRTTIEDVLNHATRSVLRTSPNIYSTIIDKALESGGDVLICDFADIHYFSVNKINVSNYKKIVVFDCLELTKFLNKDAKIPFMNLFEDGSRFSIFNFIKNNKDKLVFFVTEFNKKDVEKLGVKCVVYYKKINFSCFNTSYINSIDRKNEICMYIREINKQVRGYSEYVDNIKTKYNGIIITSDYMELWNYQRVLYTPKPVTGFIEQFGRMSFELKHFGYEVTEDFALSPNKEKTGINFYTEYFKNNSVDLSEENTIKIILDSL